MSPRYEGKPRVPQADAQLKSIHRVRDVRDEVLRAFPGADITWTTDTRRQGIVDSWPEDVDDSAARHDWGFAPRYNFENAFRDYLIPTIQARYRT